MGRDMRKRENHNDETELIGSVAQLQICEKSKSKPMKINKHPIYLNKINDRVNNGVFQLVYDISRKAKVKRMFPEDERLFLTLSSK